jgi:hypothetical protein
MPLSVTSTNLPSAPLGTMATGFWVSRAIYVAAKIGIPDLLAQGPQNVELLAEKTRSYLNALSRITGLPDCSAGMTAFVMASSMREPRQPAIDWSLLSKKIFRRAASFATPLARQFLKNHWR